MFKRRDGREGEERRREGMDGEGMKERGRGSRGDEGKKWLLDGGNLLKQFQIALAITAT